MLLRENDVCTYKKIKRDVRKKTWRKNGAYERQRKTCWVSVMVYYSRKDAAYWLI